MGICCSWRQKSKRYLYSGSNNVLDVAWYDGNSSNKRHPVGTKQANELGIFDMGGNVSEWCQDLWGQYQNDSQINPLGSSAGTKHVLRGGNYFLILGFAIYLIVCLQNLIIKMHSMGFA